ncbi:hypothetical protein BKA82DRAFT_2497098 [Pisolithus tinctorius]|nr:hypothetical protein BKA82DRAFT_2497098 [Pisolithus tinctorius]
MDRTTETCANHAWHILPKLSFMALANAFGATLFRAPNIGGVIEWIIALGFILYLSTFCYDLRMARSTTISDCRKGGGYERRWWTERSEVVTEEKGTHSASTKYFGH